MYALVRRSMAEHQAQHVEPPLCLVMTKEQRTALYMDPALARYASYTSGTPDTVERVVGMRPVIVALGDSIDWINRPLDIRRHGVPRDLDPLEQDIKAILVRDRHVDIDSTAVAIAAHVRGRLA
jgi:hypothetical protein